MLYARRPFLESKIGPIQNHKPTTNMMSTEYMHHLKALNESQYVSLPGFLGPDDEHCEQFGSGLVMRGAIVLVRLDMMHREGGTWYVL